MENVLLESSLRAAVMFAAMLVVLAVFRVRSAAARHTAWSAVLLTMLVLPAWSAWGPDLPLRVLPAADQQAEYFLPDVSLPSVPVSSGQAIAPPPTNSIPARPWPSRSVAAGFYVVVAFGMFARLLIGTIRARRIVRNAIPSGGILTSPQCAAPITVGWLKPAIILPTHWTTWTSEQRDAVLQHEQEHIRRRDSLIQWLALLNSCIFWFHPLAWWLERKLSLLAEEACDAAVLRRGHSPQDYSTYLIDLARTVQRSGARVTVHFAYRDRTLAHRVRRILHGAPVAALTRRRAALAAMATAVVLVASTACTLDRTEERAAGEPTMNELLHRRADRNLELQAREKAMQAEVNAMTPQQAQAMEDRLKANPDEQDGFFRMMRYYQRIVDVQKLDALYLWLYEHAPDGKNFMTINPEWDLTGYEKGKQIWLAHLKESNPSVEIYRRAAGYFSAADKPLAEQTMLEGQKAYPSEKWSFGTLYADALVRSEDGPFLRSVRAKLEATDDPNLLVQTAQGLRFVYGRSRGSNFSNSSVLELSQYYIHRALSIQPNHVPAHALKVQLDDLAANTKARNVVPEQLTVSERIRTLRSQLYRSTKDAEPAARQLLKLAVDNPTDPESGNAIFYANQRLGEVALRRNDKKAAVQFLRASMEAPATDLLRYDAIVTNLARGLVDWGERTLVAEFLEHCAKFNQLSYELDGWAAQIRAGKNPDLIPTRSYPGE